MSTTYMLHCGVERINDFGKKWSYIVDGTLMENLEGMQTGISVDGKLQQMTEHTELLNIAAKLKPHHLLQFSTGASGLPGSGFGKKPSINFTHTSKDSYIKTSTCDCSLTIPVTNTTKNLHSFIFVMLVSLSHGGTFSTIWFNVILQIEGDRSHQATATLSPTM